MPTETLTILLVEDDPRNACLVPGMLQAVEAFQFQLIHVSRLDEALTCLTKAPAISVILLDLSLPDVQGIDLIKQLLRVSPNIPIVVMSESYDEAIALQALRSGAQDYLVKHQTDGKLLVRSIRHALARHNAKMTTFEQRQHIQQLECMERRLLEQTQELLREKALLEAIVNSIQEGIYVTQSDGRVVLSNPANQQIWGLNSQEMAQPFQQWISRLHIQEPDGSVPTVEELPISRTLRGEMVTDYELVIRCPNGEQKWISVNGATVRASVAEGDRCNRTQCSEDSAQAGQRSGGILPFELSSKVQKPLAWENNFAKRGTPNDSSVHCHNTIQLAINTTRDITERKRTEEALLKHDRLLGGVAAAMTQLLTSTDDQAAMTRSLTILSVAVDLDRVYIFENHLDEKTSELLTSQRFGWSRDQIVIPGNSKLQNLSYQVSLPRWHQRLAAGKAVKGLVRDFPQTEQEILESDRIRSVLIVPVITEGRFWGFISFGDCQTDRQWTDHEESLLTLMAGSLGGAISRVAKEEALRESETKFRTLYESTSTAVILLDEQGIFDANSAALELFGCTNREELCGKVGKSERVGDGENSSTQIPGEEHPFIPGLHLAALTSHLPQTTSHSTNASGLTPSALISHLPIGFSPSVQPKGEESLSLAQEYIAQALTQGSSRFDWMFCKYNGEEFPAEVTLTRIELGNRKVLQAAIYDISDRKATERQLLQAKEAAEAGSRAKSEFLAMMSHELRTPLNAVLGLSQLMRQEIFGTLNDKQKEYVSCIQSSGEHLLALINDILDLSKVEAGKEQLSFMPLDIQELCEYCLAMVREQANAQQLNLTLCIEPQIRFVIADERRCKQMLINLLSNAVKFTPSGEVSLIVTQRPKEICFTVEDTGIGITSDQLPLLFEPFRQLDSGLNRRFPGTGLGLALTRSLARLHGGDVSVKSTLGQGSQFTLCLPNRQLEELILPSLSPETGEIEGQSCPLWAKSRILLVETDERSALVLKDYLQVIGHRVEHLTSGKDFLQKVRQFKPNLILMDVQLRGEYTGFDLVAALRREPDTKSLKVVMVTAMAMAGDRERCLESGADDYLSKPIGIAQLEAILMRYL